MTLVIRIALTLALIVAAFFAGNWAWDHYLYSPWTRDGRIRADVITVAPDVAGWVTELKVADNQELSQGQLIFTIDPTRYQADIAQAEAEVAHQRYAWELAQHQYQRRKQLGNKTVISDEDLETYRINTDLALASYNLAKSQLEATRINLARTQVMAPERGTLINLGLRQGNYVSKGQPVLSLVKKDSFYVTGYFEETKLPLIKVGQRAEIRLMSGGKPLTGKVVSIARGIANTNTDANNQLLPQVQQTFNWVRLAQRIPVDIALDPVPEDVLLSAGMTVSIKLSPGDHG